MVGKNPDSEACCICGHVYGQAHRVKPGCWGGKYEEVNVIYLCPNHHAGIHLMMKWYCGKRLSENEAVRLEAYADDKPLWRFFFHRIKPVVVERLQAEGKWHPYVRTLPKEEKGK